MGSGIITKDLGQVVPGNAGLEDEEDGIQGSPVIGPLASPGGLGWNMRFDHLPLLIAEHTVVANVHGQKDGSGRSLRQAHFKIGSGVLGFQLLDPLQIRCLHAAVLGLPLVVGLLTDSMLAAESSPELCAKSAGFPDRTSA